MKAQKYILVGLLGIWICGCSDKVDPEKNTQDLDSGVVDKGQKPDMNDSGIQNPDAVPDSAPDSIQPDMEWKPPYMSCPFVFLWNGKSYKYYTDLAGSVLGAGISLFDPEHYDGGVYELGGFAADASGIYRLKVRETIFEADYFDKAELVVVDLPKGYRVLSQWSFTSQLGHAAPKKLMTIKDPRKPISATDRARRNVLFEVSHVDEVPLPVTLKEQSSVVVDFGEIAHPEHAKLVLTAWSHYHDLSGIQAPPYSAGTTVETQDESGKWVVRKVGGKNPGDRRTWVMDISGIPTAKNTRMRITMAHQPIGLDLLDQVLLDDSAPVDIVVQRVKPSVAHLQYAGSTNLTYSSLTSRIHSDDAHNPVNPGALIHGDFTRYGDVRPLLEEADDRFVIMAHGDEIVFEFKDPPAKPNMDRYVFLDADVFYTIKYSVTGALLTNSIYPLPFHGMKTYPYAPAQWKYNGDADYHKHLRHWNKRPM
jgi:hypothetical protein